MALYFADRKCTCTFRLNVCRGNVVKDVSVAIVLFQLAVASGPPRVPCVLCELLKAGDVCVHGPVIPGPGTREATLDAVGGSVRPLLSFSPVLEVTTLEGNSRSSVLKAPLSMTKTKTLFSLKTSVHVHSCCSRPPLTLCSSLWKGELACPVSLEAPP